MDALIGREAEREIASTFVAAAAAGTAELSIAGEAGIGKTTLFRFALDAARQAGTRVLWCALTEAESMMSFAGLTDLLRDVEPSHFERLPAPQRRALAVATLRQAPSDVAIDERAIGTGLATMLDLLAESTPVLIAIDDAQWMDRPSADVIAFALRRLGDRPFGLLQSRRSGMTGSGLTATLLDPRWQRSLDLAGLTAAALFHVVRTHLGLTLPRPSLVRIATASQGNPFLALELVRATAGAPVGHDLPLTEALQQMVTHRLAAMSPAAREALLATACSVRPTLALLTGLGVRAGLEEAEVADVVALEEDQIVFEHPLLSAAVMQMSTAPSIRAMHARLAALATDLEAQARHFALANPDPDDAASEALDRAAVAAEARGATGAAVELAQLALDRTSDRTPEVIWRRRLRLARLLHAAGSALEAAAVLADAELFCPQTVVRAEVELLLTEVSYQTSSIQHALDHARAALDHAGADPTIRARALLALSAITTDAQETARFADEARRSLDDGHVSDKVLRAWAMSMDVAGRFNLGEGLDRPALDEALALERAGREWRSEDQVATLRPVLLKWADAHEESVTALQELRARAEAEGNDGVLPYVLGHVPGSLLRLGRFDDAAAAAAEHLAHALSTGQEGQRMQALYNVSLVEAHLGRLDAARTGSNEMLAWSLAEQDEWLEMSACGVLGFIELSAGDMVAARRWFERWSALSEQIGLIDPGVTRFHGDHIESMIAAGAAVEAAEMCDVLERRALRASRLSASAVAARCRALLAAAAGDPREALVRVDAALEIHAQCPVPFDLARTLLTKGLIHRRAKEKAAARKSLDEAAAIFAQLGATMFSARATAELDRIGTRATSVFELTATERRIAELAGSGLTNRQVAEQAFMSAKTVEANLARVYRKLGIASRAELGARMSQRSQ